VIKEYLFLSCEHGGNQIPKRYQNHFLTASKVLASHRGLDIGSLRVAQLLAKKLKVPLVAAKTSRLLVDLNRSKQNRNLFSEFTRNLSTQEKEEILENFYWPYYKKVQSLLLRQARIFHISIHSFTPKLNGELRNTDLGILYDPKSKRERQVATGLKLYFRSQGFKVRMNYPYLGTSDGLPTILRKINKAYSGLEIEMNQKFFEGNVKQNQVIFAKLFFDGLQSL
jgi:predicted N-formylglutamate amidohydrolase